MLTPALLDFWVLGLRFFKSLTTTAFFFSCHCAEILNPVLNARGARVAVQKNNKKQETETKITSPPENVGLKCF